jgi:DNA-binding CsgD family transcriptional regulator
MTSAKPTSLMPRSGRVTTLDRSKPTASAAAMANGVFTAVGRDNDVMPWPGLIQSHLHTIRGGLSFDVELRSAQPGDRGSDTLTGRERDVLALISQGCSNKRIARILEVSPETVKSHVKRIFLKLAVGTRTEAVFRAVALELM